MFTIGQLLLGVGQLLIAVCDLLLCVSQLLLGVGDLLFCFGLTCVIIRPAVFEFLFCVFQLLPAIFQLLLRIFQFLLLFFQRFFHLVQLFLVFRERLVRRVCRQIQLILIVGQSVLALVQLRLRRCKLPTRRRDLRFGRLRRLRRHRSCGKRSVYLRLLFVERGFLRV